MADDASVLRRVAESVADGAAVDWESEGRAHKHLRSRLERLHAIESIATAHGRHRAESIRADESTGFPTRPMPVAPAAPADLTHWGPLQILEKIGRGGFGEVFRAHDPSLHRDVALKLPRPDLVHGKAGSRTFLEEARRLARVKHENVLVVHGVDEHEGRVGLWTDLLVGETLEERLQSQGPLGPEEAALVGIQMCRALAAIHREGLIHRDVKATNVMRVEGGKHVLLDFSTVRERPTAAGPTNMPVTGTPLYMAPELFENEDTGILVDVYSLGVLLYRLVTRGYPVEADTIPGLAEMHRNGASRPLLDVRPDLPAGFVSIVNRAIAPKPQDRFQSVGEMERELGTVLGTHIVEPGPDLRPWWRRPRFMVASAIAVAVIAAGLAYLIPHREFNVEAALYRAGGTADERLHPGAQVFIGDGLFLEIKGSRSMWVYVLNEDLTHMTYVNFPLPGLELTNPLEANQSHRLPGNLDGVEQNWTVTNVGGTETFWVIASLKPLDEFERATTGIPRASPATPYELTPVAIGALRGVGGMEPQASKPGDRPGELPGFLEKLSARAAPQEGVWVWNIHLMNTGSPEP